MGWGGGGGVKGEGGYVGAKKMEGGVRAVGGVEGGGVCWREGEDVESRRSYRGKGKVLVMRMRRLLGGRGCVGWGNKTLVMRMGVC